MIPVYKWRVLYYEKDQICLWYLTNHDGKYGKGYYIDTRQSGKSDFMDVFYAATHSRKATRLQLKLLRPKDFPKGVDE